MSRPGCRRAGPIRSTRSAHESLRAGGITGSCSARRVVESTVKRVVSACLLAAILLSSLPWEAASLDSWADSTERLAPTHLEDAAGESPLAPDLPSDECTCLCGMCAVSSHATTPQIEPPRAFPSGPTPGISFPTRNPHLSSHPSGLFRPPKHG